MNCSPGISPTKAIGSCIGRTKYLSIMKIPINDNPNLLIFFAKSFGKKFRRSVTQYSKLDVKRASFGFNNIIAACSVSNSWKKTSEKIQQKRKMLLKIPIQKWNITWIRCHFVSYRNIANIVAAQFSQLCYQEGYLRILFENSKTMIDIYDVIKLYLYKTTKIKT